MQCGNAVCGTAAGGIGCCLDWQGRQQRWDASGAAPPLVVQIERLKRCGFAGVCVQTGLRHWEVCKRRTQGRWQAEMAAQAGAKGR